MIARFLQDDKLISRCFRGGALLGAGTAAERGLRFVRNMILTRLLAPEHLGLMALVLASSQLFEALTEVGIRQAVVQSKNGATDSYMDAAWWLNAMRGVVLYIVGWLAAPWLASFYHEPALTPLLRVAFLTLPLHGFISPGLFVLEKQLRFGRVILATQGAGLFGTLVSLALAFIYANVWALVVGFVAEIVFRFVISFLIYPYWPKFRFERHTTGELLRFSRGMVGLPILTYLFMQADIFVLGRVDESKTLLGYYSMALTLAATPHMFFARIATPMVLPIFSEMQDQKARLRNNLLRVTSLLSLFGLPMVACLVIFARPILVVVYGEGYGTVHVAFALLSFYTLLYMAGTFIAAVYLAVGRPEVHRAFAILRIVLMVLLIYPAVRWYDASGAAGIKVLCMVLAAVLQLFSLKKLMDLPVHQYLRASVRGLGLAVAVSVPALLWRFWNDQPLLHVAGAAALCLLAWAVGLMNLRKGMVKQIMNLQTPEAERV